ncbi:putative membrane protein (TIGR02234 family) [Thermocatellispora tengchongensis]|uniref:Putative membrane protein (TIGR02234 family) n=1 Tax=Thermocatellispora tengchongensis TaxID=1073253 RepID=A0A840NSV0_9ACTN|nr:Trp biosynthesis-associated membrane protein [Thermocatellispora tengchongensis]MBB5131764.1 putative membrane protein (TIGR02234 family) [Thermocatellispora tengchongensis]
MRGGAGPWVLACAAGAGLALLASGREWATVASGTAGPHGQIAVTGGELSAGASTLALAGGAAALAVLAARGVWRRVLAVALALCGAGVAAAACSAALSGSAALDAAAAKGVIAGDAVRVAVAWPWPAAAVAGGLVLVAAGVVAVIRGGRWRGMSDRYERPGTRTASAGAARSGAPASARELWDAIDQGADPTLDGDPAPGRSEK